MKSTRVRFSLLIVALALSTQLSYVSASPLAGQNANSSTTVTTTTRTTTYNRRRSRCTQNCNRAYRLCTRGIAPPHVARCRERLRRCLRRCRY